MAPKKKGQPKDPAALVDYLAKKVTRLKKKLTAADGTDIERRQRKRLKRAQRRRRTVAKMVPKPTAP